MGMTILNKNEAVAQPHLQSLGPKIQISIVDMWPLWGVFLAIRSSRSTRKLGKDAYTHSKRDLVRKTQIHTNLEICSDLVRLCKVINER